MHIIITRPIEDCLELIKNLQWIQDKLKKLCMVQETNVLKLLITE